jgi:hypothetical protein
MNEGFDSKFVPRGPEDLHAALVLATRPFAGCLMWQGQDRWVGVIASVITSH